MNPAKIMARTSDLFAAIAVEDPIAIARAIAGLGLDLVPIELLREHLDADAIARANAEADLAERLKFGASGDG